MAAISVLVVDDSVVIRLTVSEARAGDRPESGTSHMAPGDFHLRVRTDRAGVV